MTGRRRGVIFDRDGVINIDTNYLYRIEDCVFVEGIFELLADFQSRGYALAIATNQAGIGRGYYTEGELRVLTAWMSAQFAEHGVLIDAFYHSPDHPTEGVGAFRRESDWRKPGPGMFVQAIADLGLEPSQSWAIGDSERDMAAAVAARIGHRVLYAPLAQPGRRADGVRVVSTLADVPALVDAAEARP